MKMNEFSRILAKMAPSIREKELSAICKNDLTGIKREILHEKPVTVYVHKASRKNAPVLFELHGGGFVVGDAIKNDAIAEYLSKSLDINVISINYSKAPEQPFPVAVEEVYSVIRWFYENSEQEELDKNAFAVMGFSAGANLSAVAAILGKERGGYQLCAQVMHYPYLDAVTPVDQKPKNTCDIPIEVMIAFKELYSKDEERYLPTVSPVLAKAIQLEGIAPALILTAENDALWVEGKKYAEMLESTSVETYYACMAHAHHGYVEDWFNEAIYELIPEDKKHTHHAKFGETAVQALRKTEEFLIKQFKI